MKKIVLNGKEREITEKTVGVYAVWVGDCVYIGSGKILDRKRGNLSKLRRNKHDNKTLQEAYNKIGEAGFELITVVENDEKAREIESLNIEYYKLIDGITVCNKRPAKRDCTSLTYNKHKRLNKEQVAEIKYILINNINSVKEIADMYNTSLNAIRLIKNGFRWKNVEPVKSL